jgi:cation diffusion facilitator CzcD-associated flavoprotein CzcO
MKIAIIGAGFAGLSSAKFLKQFGHNVTVFEKEADVGGVWSKSRIYPGLTTQNVKETYYLSDMPMPKDYPEYPRGDQVQAYLESYAKEFGLTSDLRLGTEVRGANLDEQAGTWTVTTQKTNAGEPATEQFDYLVVASGIFSDPFIPAFEGVDEYKKAGGQICAVSQCPDMESLKGKNVLVVGYGKSACDIAMALSDVADSTTVIARNLIWKMPKKIGNAVHYKYIFLTRMGEALIPYLNKRGIERFFHGVGRPVRESMLGSVQSAITRQLKLKKLGLLPEGKLERIARSNVSLATDGFYKAVEEDKLSVKRDATITRVFEKDGQPQAELSTGETLPADAIICGTGWKQTVPFFSEDMVKRLTNNEDDFELYQYIQPLEVPRLSFVGYNSSFFSPLSAEVAALWVGAYLEGALDLPSVDEQRRLIAKRLQWMKERTEGKHAHGTNLIPFSMHNIDETLNEIGVNLGPGTRFVQWLLPPKPTSYQKVTAKILKKKKKAGSASFSDDSQPHLG